MDQADQEAQEGDDRTYLPGEEKEALLCLDPHHMDQADQEAQEGDDKDLPARGGERGAAVS